MSSANLGSNQNGGVSEGEQPFECVPGANLYIKNLDDLIDDEWLKRTFGCFGSITSAKVMRHDGGASKGFGFVCFSTAEEAAVAKNELNGKLLPECSKPLYVNIAQKKEERRAFLIEQYSQPLQAWRNGAPVTTPDRWMPVQNGRPAQEPTPPRTHSSPLQVPSTILPLSAKPNHHLSNHHASLPVAAAPAIPLAGVPTQQVAGMNGFVMVGPPLRQPFAAAAAPRPNFYLNPSVSTVPQPTVQRFQYAQVGAPWQYPVNSRQAGQTYAMHPTHVHVAASAPAPAAQYVVSTMGAKIPHVHLHQQGQGVNVMHVPIPYGVAQPAALQQVRPVGSVSVAAYPGQSHHSVWANGMP